MLELIAEVILAIGVGVLGAAVRGNLLLLLGADVSHFLSHILLVVFLSNFARNELGGHPGRASCSKWGLGAELPWRLERPPVEGRKAIVWHPYQRYLADNGKERELRETFRQRFLSSKCRALPSRPDKKGESNHRQADGVGRRAVQTDFVDQEGFYKE